MNTFQGKCKNIYYCYTFYMSCLYLCRHENVGVENLFSKSQMIFNSIKSANIHKTCSSLVEYPNVYLIENKTIYNVHIIVSVLFRMMAHLPFCHPFGWITQQMRPFTVHISNIVSSWTPVHGCCTILSQCHICIIICH